MNIEEERKAFEKALPIPDGVTWYPTRSRYFAQPPATNAFASHATAQFVAWLAAKRHAAEMAKPTVRIKPKSVFSAPSNYPFVVSLFEGETFNGVLEDFSTKEGAIEWANRNGYRVIE